MLRSQSHTSPKKINAIKFADASANLEFVYHDQLPAKSVTLRIKGESAYRVNLSMLHLYGLYRNSVFDSYGEKPDLAEDIKNRKKEYHENDNSPLSKGELYNSPLYHYSVAASLGTVKEWSDSEGKMKCYMVYHNDGTARTKVGFVHFIEQTINDKKVIYIAQAGVKSRGMSIGRHLMECVLTHFPANTEFYILTRVFNTDAKNLYQKRLAFTAIEADEIKQLGYDERYCGFKHTTTQLEVDEINARKLQVASPLPSNDETKSFVRKL